MPTKPKAGQRQAPALRAPRPVRFTLPAALVEAMDRAALAAGVSRSCHVLQTLAAAYHVQPSALVATDHQRGGNHGNQWTTTKP